MRLNVLELGSYVAPAYAGMILAEQGHSVTKWTLGNDPVQGLNNGDKLWDWINHGKHLAPIHSKAVKHLTFDEYDIIIDNHRAEAWERWGVDPAIVAKELGVVWVSLRADDDGRSFDVVAQARAWGDMGVLPFYLGDTAAGLWLAFKALAAKDVGHYVIRQAAVLAKLVEGELVVDRAEPWDAPGTYYFDGEKRCAVVDYRGEQLVEPVRDSDWRRTNLAHTDGRFNV